MTQPQEPREVTPVQMWGPGAEAAQGYHDFRPNPIRSDAVDGEEAKEAEEALTPAPKDESAPASVDSLISPSKIEQPASVAPVPPAPEPTTVTTDADKASGRVSESSEDEPLTTPTESPKDESSSPSSSSPTSPGVPMPPALVKPPTAD